MRTLERLVLTAILLAGGAAPLSAQTPTTYEACYVPGVGAIYLINQAGLPSACLAPSHVAFSWTTGDLADGAVTEAKLAFDPATQAELDAFLAGLAAAGTINAAGNPVDWTQLKNVPAAFADGVDNTGGTPSDLVCAGCVETTDLADGAVNGAKVAAGAVDVPHLAFDPATQAELDAFVAGLAAGGVINAAGNPVDWTQLKNVPAGFADGVDDGGGGVTDHGTLTGLADDDHPQYLLAGVRAATDGFAVTGTLNTGTIPATGTGVRLMWYPRRAALRAGGVNGTQWDDANVGTYSTAMGYNTIASGNYATAMGQSATASANFATALGQNTTASGLYSTAMGDVTTASGSYATALGFSTHATGDGSTAMGWSTTASGNRSAALGTGTTASGYAATALGNVTTAQAYASLAIGRYNTLAGDATQWLATDPLLVAGNGASAVARSNALTLYKNGDLDLAGTVTAGAFVGDGSGLTNLPSGVTDHGALTGLGDDDHHQYLLAGVRAAVNGFAVTGFYGSGTIPATGAGTRLMWYPAKAAFRAGNTLTQWDDANVGAYSTATGDRTTASGLWSTAMGISTTASDNAATALGSGTTASGATSVAMGNVTTASGAVSVAMGNGTTASGPGSTAMGGSTTASGTASTAMGQATTASGSMSTALGQGTAAQSYASVAIGRFNVVTGSQTQWLDTDPLFVAGNGASDAARSDALTLLKNGNLTIAGTLTENSDIRLKEDIEPLQGALEELLELTPIRYRFRDGTGHPVERQIGLSAQEVEQAFPELVSRDSKGYLSVAYTNLTAVLVRAVQEQQVELEAARARTTALATEIAALRAEVAALRTTQADTTRIR